MADGTAILRGDPGYRAFDAPPPLLASPPTAASASPMGVTVPADAAPPTDAGTPPPPSTDDAAKASAIEKFKSLGEDARAAAHAALADINGKKIPELIVPPKPQFQQTTPAQAWGSAAMVFAALGSLLTRTPLTTAMNAMAGVMKGFREGDQQAFDNNFKVWQAESENAYRLASFELEAYHAAIQGVEEKLSIGERLTAMEQADLAGKIMSTSSTLNDPVANQVFQNYGTPGFLDLMQKRAAAVEQYQKSRTEANTLGLTAQAFNEWKNQFTKDNNRAPTAQESQAKWKALENQYQFSTMSEDTKNMVADMYLAGNRTVIQGMGLDRASKQDIWNRITERAASKGISPTDLNRLQAEFFGEQAAARAAGTRSAQISIAADAANRMSDLVLKTAAKVPLGNYPAINMVTIAYLKNTGDPAVIQLGDAIASFVQAYARAISPSGVATDALRAKGYSMIAESMSKNQLAAGLATMKQEMQNEIAATGDVFKNIPQPGETIQDNAPVVPVVRNDADYKALPIGTEFMDENGKRFTKTKDIQ